MIKRLICALRGHDGKLELAKMNPQTKVYEMPCLRCGISISHDPYEGY